MDIESVLKALPTRDDGRYLEPCVLNPERKIGEGGMASVYLARHLNLQIDVAVKILLTDADTSPDKVKRFTQEAQLAAAINHPNLVRVYDIRFVQGIHYIIMELVRGLSVRELVKRDGPLTVRHATSIALGAASGLAAAHEAGVIHRDVKPGNIMVSDQGETKVVDLGLAKAIQSGDLLQTLDGIIMGTPQYMPLEQFVNSADVRPAADVYALGATLYFMLTGRDGIALDRFLEMRAQVESGFPDVRKERTDVPEELSDIVRRATSLNEADRYPNAAALSAELSRFFSTARIGLEEPTRVIGSAHHLPVQWSWRAVHALQPAAHFAGRASLLKRLTAWWHGRSGRDRVVSLIGVGGCGKTSVVARLLDEVRDLPLEGNVLVWSFYEDANVGSFLREACNVFAPGGDSDAGGRLERLQRALDQGPNHCLILDGLETLQSQGDARFARGEILDPQLRNLLRLLAAGLGASRALMTSRTNIPDLGPWEEKGYTALRLAELEPLDCRQLLKAWGIQGEAVILDEMAERAGRHALSLTALGSFVRTIGAGDVTCLHDFDLGEAAIDLPQASRLRRLLDHYAEALPEGERRLLGALALFPRAATLESVHRAATGGLSSLSAIAALEQPKLRLLARRLEERGLVFSNRVEGVEKFNAHPFLRKYFRDLNREHTPLFSQHLRSELQAELDGRPERFVKDSVLLDLVEEVIGVSLDAGAEDEAWDLYTTRMGGYERVGYALGDYARITRVLRGFFASGRLSANLSRENHFPLLRDLGLAAHKIGDLDLSQQSFNEIIVLSGETNDRIHRRAALRYLSATEADRGRFPAAKKLAEEASAISSDHPESDAFADLGRIFHALGETTRARQGFAMAERLERSPLRSFMGIYEIEHLIDTGSKSAEKRALMNLEDCKNAGWADQAAICHTLLGRLKLTTDFSAAADHLKSARARTIRSGHIESILRCRVLAVELAGAQGQMALAQSEAESGLTLASGCGMQRWVWELLRSLARSALRAGQPAAALKHATALLDGVNAPGCSHGWIEADALHLKGAAFLALGEIELSRQTLAAALAKRETLSHPETEETRRLLRQVTA